MTVHTEELKVLCEATMRELKIKVTEEYEMGPMGIVLKFHQQVLRDGCVLASYWLENEKVADVAF